MRELEILAVARDAELAGRADEGAEIRKQVQVDFEHRKSVRVPFRVGMELVDHGDGSDGDVVVTGQLVAQRDMNFDNLILVGDAKINPNGFRIRVRGYVVHQENER